MNFQEALKEKEKNSETINMEGVTYKVLVTPKNKQDYEEYLNNFTSSERDDKTAKLYSSDGEYEISAIYTDGHIVLHDKGLGNANKK